MQNPKHQLPQTYFIETPLCMIGQDLNLGGVICTLAGIPAA